VSAPPWQLISKDTAAMAKQIHTHRIDQRPDVEVLVDGPWYPDHPRQWIEDDGRSRIDTFPADRVRRHPVGVGFDVGRFGQ
jgi:hypothetical protein